MSFLQKRGKYWYLYEYRQGKLTGRSLKTIDKETAKEYLRKHDENKARQKLNLPLKDTSWAHFSNRYLEYSKANKAVASYKKDITIVSQFTRIMAPESFSDYTADLIEKYKGIRRENGYLLSTINRELNTLLNMGRKAEEWGFAAINPVRGVRRYPNKRAHKKRYLSHEEIKRLIKTVKGSIWENAVYAGLYQATRAGECCHLEWADIDLERKQMTIQAKGSWHPKDYECRVIPLMKDFYNYCLQVKKREGWFLARKNGTPTNERVLASMFLKIMKKAQIKDASYHTLRHTCASYLAMNGADQHFLKEFLGHASYEPTQVYIHLSPDYMKKMSEVNLYSITN